MSLLGDDARFSDVPYHRGLSRVVDPLDTGCPLDLFVIGFLSYWKEARTRRIPDVQK